MMSGQPLKSSTTSSFSMGTLFRSRTMTVKVRYPDFAQEAHGRSLAVASDLETAFYPLLGPLLRRFGVRTQQEIDAERYALRLLRGDFEQGPDATRRALRVFEPELRPVEH